MTDKLHPDDREQRVMGASFDEPLPSAGVENRPSRGYRPPNFPQQLADELAATEKERARLAQDNLYLSHKLRVARVFGNDLAVRVVTALLLWAVFHLCLWSWNRTAPMEAGQQSYQYIATAIRKGMLPPMDRLAAMPDQNQAPTPQPQPTPAVSK